MSDQPLLPLRAQGAPIPGDAAIASLVPFGLDRDKPRHFREMAEVLWENRDSLPYAWNILRQGVCDGCSLGPRGLEDDVIPGVHLCMSRLKLLRNNTIGAFAPADVLDIGRLRRMNNSALRQLGRIPVPLVYRRGDRGLRRVSWDEALRTIGEGLREVAPERMAFFASSKGLTNEAYYAFTKAARALGTNNVDFCARLCHAATVSGLGRTIGVGAPTVSLSDLVGTDLVLLWGTNLANNQPVSVKYLHHAKTQGTRVVVINPVPEKGLEAYWVPSIALSAVFGSRIQDDYIPVRVGGDIALLNAVMKVLIGWGAVDRAFIDAHTRGWEDLVSFLDGQSLPSLCAEAGVEPARVEWLATLIARARTMVTVYSMGLTQHRFGTQNVQGVVNLHLARGAIGRPKSGILPIRGHSGVQGGGECGVTPDKLPGGVRLDEASAERFTGLWGFEVPTAPGLATGGMLEAAHDGKIDFLYNLGGNLHHTMPEPGWVERAFAQVKLRVHQDIHLNTSTVLEPGETLVVLPAQTRYEQRGGGTSTSTERRIRFSPEIEGHPILGESRPEWEIPGQVVQAARPDRARAFAWADAQDVREEMDRVMPIYKGINQLRQAGDSLQWGGPLLCVNGDFAGMPDRRALFSALDTPRNEAAPGRFLLTTRRGKQFNSMVFSSEDAVQGGRARDELFLCPEDAAALGLREGERVVLRNGLGSFTGTLRLIGMVPGTVQAYWPEVNGLIPRRFDPVSGEPDYNAEVEVSRA